MAEQVAPENVERSGIDPTKGSILSQDARNDLFRRFTVESSVFRNQLTSLESTKREEDLKNTSAIQEQEQILVGVNSNIQSLREDIGRLGTGLASIALLLQQDSAEEQSRTRAEQERQRRLAEQQIRIGKENEIEERIQNAILEPVQRLVPKVDDIFGNIGRALGILFGGWLTNQVVQAIRASEENNTKLFNDIKFNIIKNLAIVGGGLFAIRAGFSLIGRTIKSIASGLTRLLIAKPLAIAAALLPRVGSGGGGGKPSGGKPSGGGGMLGLIGSVITGVTGALNFLNGENVDAALAALSFVPGGGIFKLARVAAGTVFTLDQIAEALGKNFTGADPKLLEQKKKELEEAKNKEKQKPTSSPKITPTSTPTPPAPAPSSTPTSSEPAAAPTPTPPAPTAQPQTPMMGEQKPSTPAPSPDMVSKFEQAWQYRNNPFARGRIEDAWGKMTPDQKQQAKEWASSKGYDWKEMKLPDAPAAAMATPATPAMISGQSESKPPEPTGASPAQMTPPSKEPTQVGQLPEPKPSLTMIATSNNANQNANPPITNGALTDVPFINSSNPDNFYVLYSQLSYNVVM